VRGTLEDRLVLVTGAARGLGAALAAGFADRGARVVVTDVDAGQAERCAASLVARGHWSRSYELDVTRPADVRRVAETIQHRHGNVSLLVNNAGVVFGGAFLEVGLERHLQTYRVNAEGLVTVTHVFLPQLLASPSGNVVNIASASGFIGLPWGTTYASSKWSVVGFSEGLRLELAEAGHRHVKVTAVCPGYIETGLFSGARPPRLTRVLTPATVARRVVRAVERGRRRLLLPTLARLGPISVALPAGVGDALGRLLGVHASMREWKGHASREEE
jgi:short-subunit dehydrogenase